ncbi:MAG: YihY/virulence factor BrkB family protein [Balneolaceae bacterium]
MKLSAPNFHSIRKDAKEILGKTFSKAIDDDIMTQGAAIAFYTVFSVAPLFILVVAVSDLFLSEEYITTQVEAQLTALLGSDISSNLVQYIGQVSFDTSGVFTTIIASATVIFGATTVITQLKNSLNKIWNVESVEIHSVWNFLLNRLLSFGIIILTSLLLIGSLLTEAVIGIISGFFSQTLPTIDLDFYLIITEIATITFAVLFFALIFKILPDVIAPWKHIFIGAIATTMLFMAGKYLIGMYLTSSGISAAYRAAGSLIIFIVWVYYNVQTILLGAVFTQVYTEHSGGKILPYRFVRLRSK